MKTYIKTKTIRLSDIQYNTLIKMRSYNIEIGKFIRDAISEKIKKEYNELIPKPKKENCPF